MKKSEHNSHWRLEQAYQVLHEDSAKLVTGLAIPGPL